MTQHLRSRDALTTRAARPELVPTAPRRTAGDLVRGLGAAGLLLVMVVGIPALLLVVGQLHVVGMPSWSTVWGALTRPDDGHLFLAALTVLAWLAWATFTLSVIVEAIAILRGLPSPRLPLLSVPQHAAAALVATFSFGASAQTPPPAATTPPAATPRPPAAPWPGTTTSGSSARSRSSTRTQLSLSASPSQLNAPFTQRSPVKRTRGPGSHATASPRVWPRRWRRCAGATSP